MTRLLRGEVLLTGSSTDARADGWVLLDGDRIAEVGVGPGPVGMPVAATYPVLAPGFVDIHNHGGGRASFAEGPEAARVAARAHLLHGTTSLVASLVTDTRDALADQLRALRPLVAAGELGGLHLEGPWLAERWCGAQPPELLRDPSPAEVGALAEAAGPALVMVTLAPERPGALEAIATLAARGIRVGVGHTDATYAVTREAVGAGASIATHLYNAARPPHHREPGPSVALLEDEGVWVETIADGVHQHPAVVRATALRAGRRWVLVSDAMAAALAGDGGYRLGRLEPGARADLVGLGEDLQVRDVIRAGRQLG